MKASFSHAPFKNLLIFIIAGVLVLTLVLVPKIPQAGAADVSWTKTGTVTLKDGAGNPEKFVLDYHVIKDGSTYKLWYTHVKLASGFSLTTFLNNLASLLPSDIQNDLATLDLDSLLTHLAAADAGALYSVLTSFNVVVGYATSTDGLAYTIVDDDVVTAGSGGAFDHAGTPYVVKNASGSPANYQMWYSRTTQNLTQVALGTILGGLSGDATARGNAIDALKVYTDTVISYRTSADGITWTAAQNVTGVGTVSSPAQTRAGMGAPCVYREGSTYHMWYTVGQTDIDSSGLVTILGSLASFSSNAGTWLAGIFDGTNTVINHATSTDGVTWSSDAKVTGIGSGGITGSVGFPEVKYNGSGYDMWYTSATTDMTTANLKELIDTDILGLGLMSYFTAAKNDPVNFLVNGAGTDIYDLVAATGSIQTKLNNTRTVISAASSTNGTSWTVDDVNDLVGASNAVWSSVGAPTIINDSGTYKMWFTQGISDFTALNIVSMFIGSTLPIGYATGSIGATVTISVVLQGGARPDPAGWLVPLTVKFFTPGTDVLTGTPVYTRSGTTTKSNGTAQLQVTGIASGTYDISAVSEHTLTNRQTNVAISAPSTSVNMYTLLEGDANTDNIVNILDFSTMSAAWLKSTGEGSYNASADYDRNGIINILDFSLLSAQWLVQAPNDVP